MNFIDYSQYKAFMKCPWYWYERYVNQVEKIKPAQGYASDPMTIGSLTHSGLENWAKIRKPVIDSDLIAKLGPSPEALALACQLVQEYVTRYPNEEFINERTEEPIKFKLPGLEIDGLALIDNHFYNEKDTQIESGIPGEIFALTKGWWIREYKTKDAGRPRAGFAQAWAVNMQADFQLHALKAKTGEVPQGIFVCVLEKPKLYIPKRKCKGCAELIELEMYLPTGTGAHACPYCGNIQTLKPYVAKVERKAEVYRIPVTRTEDQLSISLDQICTVAIQMSDMRQNPRHLAPNKEACVVFNSVCDYFNPHTYNRDATQDPEMVKRDATKYVRLEEVKVY